MSILQYSEISDNWWIDFFQGEYVEVVLTQNPEEVFQFMSKIGHLEAGMRVFDQCCGRGHLSRVFADAGMHVTAIDSSVEFIEYARKNTLSEDVSFVCGDARYFSDENRFDICINWNTSFAYSEGDRENELMIAALSRNLKPGGQVYLSTMNPRYIHKHFQRFIVKEVPYEDSSIITIRESLIENKMMKSEWTIIYPDGRREKRYGQTKLYSSLELRNMLLRHGITTCAQFGDIFQSDYDEDHPNLIIYGHKH